MGKPRGILKNSIKIINEEDAPKIQSKNFAPKQQVLNKPSADAEKTCGVISMERVAMEKKKQSNSPEETESIGQALAETLRPGTVIAFTGDLGAGKTAFVRGLARGLGITARVTSPTFTIVNEYEGGRLPLFHFDMYRLSSAQDLFDIGWDDFLQRGGICAVEWSENVADALEDCLCVEIRRGESDTQRKITLRWEGNP